MSISDIKDEIQDAVQADYRKIIEETILHYGLDEYLGFEVSSEDMVEFATELYSKKYGNKIVDWSKRAFSEGENGRG